MNATPSRADAANRRSFMRRLAKPKIKVICRKGSLDLGPNLATSVLDISESGIRMVVKESLAVNQDLSISLEGVLHMRPIKCTGKVAWAAKLAETGYCIGIQLDKYLTYKDIRLLT